MVYMYVGCDFCWKVIKWFCVCGVDFVEKLIWEMLLMIGELWVMLKF